MAKRKIPSVYFTSLEIQNVRCFGELQTLDLTVDGIRPARWTLILGDNGVGKTTLLQCLAWMQPVLEINVKILYIRSVFRWTPRVEAPFLVEF